MPSHPLHLIVDQLVLGKEFIEVHRYMDRAQQALQSNHRIIGHDEETIAMFAEIDELAGWSAYLHIMLDEVSMIVGQERAVYTLMKMIEEGLI